MTAVVLTTVAVLEASITKEPAGADPQAAAPALSEQFVAVAKLTLLVEPVTDKLPAPGSVVLPIETPPEPNIRILSASLVAKKIGKFPP